MRKFIPLVAAAIVVPLVFGALAAFASSSAPLDSSGDTPPLPLGPVPTSTSVVLSTSNTPDIAPDEGVWPGVAEGNAPQVSIPETVSATLTSQIVITPTEPTPPNAWVTPEPTANPPNSPTATGGPIEMTVSWDGLKCARSDAWTVQTVAGPKWMCPGSKNP